MSKNYHNNYCSLLLSDCPLNCIYKLFHLNFLFKFTILQLLNWPKCCDTQATSLNLSSLLGLKSIVTFLPLKVSKLSFKLKCTFPLVLASKPNRFALFYSTARRHLQICVIHFQLNWTILAWNIVILNI